MWGLRFRVSAARDALEILPPLAQERIVKGFGPGDNAAVALGVSSGCEEQEAFDTDACHSLSRTVARF